MPDLKLRKLPDRTPVKITFKASAALNASLEAYTAFYRETYGQEEPLPELIPYMLEAFLKSDGAFNKALREKTTPRPDAKRVRPRPAEATSHTS
jgi:hypothetical protein